MKKKMAKYVTWYMVIVMFLIGITPRAYAGFSPSEEMALFPLDRPSDLQKIQKVLESKMIRERLNALGFSQEEIQARFKQLSDEQVHQIALKLDELNVGGDGEVIIILLLIAVIAGLVFYLLGYRMTVKKG